MASPGINYEGLISAVDPPHQNGTQEANAGNHQHPTDSHALAVGAHDVRGAAQRVGYGEDVKDLGWNEPEHKIAAPLIGGLQNEELWLLIRRFNKQIYHVKELKGPVSGDLDLNVAEEEEFSPDKLRSTVERLYMTVIVGMISFSKHIVRLRSWRETQRTACFCLAYSIAWIFDFLTPLFVTTLVVLIAYPPSRDILFPPAPIALVDSRTGGPQKPGAGVLGSHDSVTGAPENYKGEAVEMEASNFTNSIAHIALSSVSGKNPHNDPSEKDGEPGDLVPDPTAAVMGAADARVAAAGGKTGEEHDKTKEEKVPMQTAMWTKMRPIMRSLGDIVDTWERFANALSPTPPFPKEAARLRLAAIMVPFLFGGLIISSYVFVKALTFGAGFGFFGGPVIERLIVLLNRKFPHWQRLLELRNTVLKGVPTNAQLTLTLLRMGESHNAPLPPPPSTSEPPPMQAAHVDENELSSTGADAPLGATSSEIDLARAPDPTAINQSGGHDIDQSKAHKHGKKGMRILRLFKSTVKATVETAIGADRLKASAGSTNAKNRLGVLPRPTEDLTSGPVEFKARYHGKKGHLFISGKAAVPFIFFTTESDAKGVALDDPAALNPVWSIPIGDITSVKKVGGFGWKAKLLVGWALDREVADGCEITDRVGTVWKITACPLRDELFNRLIALGGQKWESW